MPGDGWSLIPLVEDDQDDRHVVPRVASVDSLIREVLGRRQEMRGVRSSKWREENKPHNIFEHRHGQTCWFERNRRLLGQ
jgi:deoxyribodipyrimidine photolyase-like uncharacterized protein